MSDNCTQCGKGLNRRTLKRREAGQPTSGLCGACYNASKRIPPKRCSDCGVSVSTSSGARCWTCSNRRLASDPQWRAKHRRGIARVNGRQEYREARYRGILKAADRQLSWCPLELRDEYRRLTRHYACAKRARAAIEEQMTPFARQLAKVLSGQARVYSAPPLRTAGNQRIDGSINL